MRSWTDWPGEGEMEGFLECWRGGGGSARRERLRLWRPPPWKMEQSHGFLLFFPRAAFVMWSQSVCLADAQKTHIYFSPARLHDSLLSRSLFVSQRPRRQNLLVRRRRRPPCSQGRRPCWVAARKRFLSSASTGSLSLQTCFVFCTNFDPLTSSRSERERTLIWTDDVAPPRKTQTLC